MPRTQRCLRKEFLPKIFTGYESLAACQLESMPHWSEVLAVGSETDITGLKNKLGYGDNGIKIAATYNNFILKNRKRFIPKNVDSKAKKRTFN